MEGRNHRSGQPWRPFWPARDDIGESVPSSFVLGRSERTAIGISGIVAFKEGFIFDLMLRIRGADPALSAFSPPGDEHPVAERARRAFRMTLEFADGIIATSHLAVEAMRPGPAPKAPQLILMDGGGSGGMWDMRWLVTAIPPPGRLDFVSEWPEVEMAFRHTIAGSLIADAAARSLPIWG